MAPNKYGLDAGLGEYGKWITNMKQTWLIDGEWSQYHNTTAVQQGWVLSHKSGLWEIVAIDVAMFPTDEAARHHVLACEANPEHKEHTLARIAVNAIMVGNMRG